MGFQRELSAASVDSELGPTIDCTLLTAEVRCSLDHHGIDTTSGKACHPAIDVALEQIHAYPVRYWCKYGGSDAERVAPGGLGTFLDLAEAPTACELFKESRATYHLHPDLPRGAKARVFGGHSQPMPGLRFGPNTLGRPGGSIEKVLFAHKRVPSIPDLAGSL